MASSYRSRIPKITAELAPKLDAVVVAGAQAIAEDAKDRVHVRTGKLRDRIHVERQGFAEYMVVAGDEEVFYGHLEEYGGAHSPPHPFMMPALEANRAGIVSSALTVLKTL